MATYEQIKKANESIKTTPIKGKDYAEVNQRIKAFRMVYPEGFIDTELMSDDEGVCVFHAEVGFYDEDGMRTLLGSGTAYEKESNGFINKTSYIENCETSAVGRALGMAGFGIDTSVASAEEVENAILNQNKPEEKATPAMVATLSKVYTGENLEKLLKANKISKLEDLPLKTASEIMRKLSEKSK